MSKALAIVGTFLQLGLLISMLVVVASVGASLQDAAELTASENAENVEQLEHRIGERFKATFWSTLPLKMAAHAGLIMSFVAAVVFSYRARWYFWVSVALCLVWLLHVPVGTLFGGVFLLFLLVRRREFLGANRPAES